jgi:hypothetical protein
LFGVAVNVTDVPAQIAVAVAAIVVLGVVAVFTVIVKAFDVAVVETAHAAFEVKIQVTTSLLFKLVEVNVAPVAAFTPFTRH